MLFVIFVFALIQNVFASEISVAKFVSEVLSKEKFFGSDDFDLGCTLVAVGMEHGFIREMVSV